MRLIDADRLVQEIDPMYVAKKGIVADTFAEGCIQFEKLVKQQPTVSQWIPVSERLPEEDGEYLVTWMMATKSIGDIRPFIGIWEYEEGWGFDKPDYVNWYDDVRVTAWMEPPEVYREKD